MGALLRRHKTVALEAMLRMIGEHGLLQTLRGVHLLLQGSDTTGGFQSINTETNGLAKQPIKRWKGLSIDYGCDTNDQWIPSLIGYRYRTQTPRLPAEEFRYSSALRISGSW